MNLFSLRVLGEDPAWLVRDVGAFLDVKGFLKPRFFTVSLLRMAAVIVLRGEEPHFSGGLVYW